ncbi:hypothetical protein F5Y18DRAFT_89438 [Xylariaceae sp. FL1019]|nr:hypothetical protein F5Y18DRAFT_89438 [Xylariaceae sp. FL1019]
MPRLRATSVFSAVAFVPSGATQLKTVNDEEESMPPLLRRSIRNRLRRHSNKRKHGERDDEDGGGDEHDDDHDTGDDDEDDDDDTKGGDGGDEEGGNSGPGYPESTTTLTTSSIIQNVASPTTTITSPTSPTSLPTSSVTTAFPDSSLPVTSSSTITKGGSITQVTSVPTASPTSNSTPTSLVNQAGGTDSTRDDSAPADDGPNPNEEVKINRTTGDSIAGGVVGGILLLLGLLFILYCVRTRRKRREWLKREKAASTNDSDIEGHSHVTVDLRDWQAPSMNLTRSNNEVSNYSNVPRNLINLPVPGSSPSADRTVDQRSIPITPPERINTQTGANVSPLAASTYRDLNRHSQVTGLPPNLGYNDPFADIYVTPSPTYSQASLHTYHNHSYSATPPRVMPVHAPILMPNLPTSAHFNTGSMSIDGPPPPQYPEAMRSPPLRCCSSHSTLSPPRPISPLTPPPLPVSDLDAVLGTKPEPPPPPPPPRLEIVSPIHQLGQTSASLAEFDEAAIVDGRPPPAPLAYNDEKQPTEPQEGASRD